MLYNTKGFTETTVDLFDLLFIALLLASMVTLTAAAISGLGGRRRRARGLLRGWSIGAAIYLAIVVVVSLATPRRVLRVGDPQCSDDWCLAVEDVQRTPLNSAVSYAVTLRLFSRAQRRAQREKGVSVYLLDARGRRYDPLPDASEVPLDILLQPQESVTAKRVFRLPADAGEAGLVVDHGSGFPGCLVIGENTWFHRPAVVQLDGGRRPA